MPESGNMITRMLASLGVDYTPAILAGKQFAQSLGTVNAQLLQLQRTAKLTGAVLGSDIASGIERSRVIYDQYGNVLKRVTLQQEQMTQEAKKQAQTVSDLASTRQRINEHFLAREQANLQRHLREIEGKEKLSTERRLALETQYYARAEREARQFYQRQVGNFGEMSDQLERRMGWFWAGLGFYGAQDVFRRALTTIGEIEMGMIELARIQDDVTFNFEEMRQELFELGKTYGQTWQVVQDIALRWSQAGLNVRDTLEATRASLLALNTAELNAEQSTTALVGIMAQWNLEATDLLDVIDKINITADNFVVTSQDIVDGLLRASGSARVLGLSLEETIALLTVMREASGRTGREVGNALNSIFSYLQRDKAIKTFEALGIDIWADEAKTQFRNVLEIFEQVSSRWDEIGDEFKDGFVAAASEAGLFNEEFAESVGLQEEWNDLQKRDISQAMAGVYRRNYLLALMQNFAKTQEVLNNLTDAHGYSMRENERTMEAYQKRVEALRMAVTELAVAIGDAGLLDIMKGLVDGTREAIEEFRQLPQPVQEAMIAFLGLTAALAGINLTFRVFMGMGIGGMLINLAAHIAKVEAATLGLGAALRILATNPVMLAITAIGTLTGAIIAFNRHQAQAAERAKEAAEDAISHAANIKELAAKYEELNGKVELSANEHKELRDTMNALAEIFPGIVEQWDAQGNAIAFNNDLLRENIILAREAAAANAMDYYTKLLTKRSDLEKNIERATTPVDYSGYGLLGKALSRPVDIKRVTELKNELARVDREISVALAMIDRTTTEGGIIGATLSAKRSSGKSTTTGGKPDPEPAPAPPPGTASAPPPGTASDQLREMANIAKLALDEYNLTLDELDSRLQSVAARERVLALEMQSGTVPTTEQLQRKYALLSETIHLNTERQNTLRDAMKAAQTELSGLESKFNDLVKQHESGKLSTKDFNAAVGALRPTINELKSSIHQYQSAWWDAEYNIKAAMQSIKQAQDDLARSAYDNAMAIMRHEVAMARMSTQQQIDYLRQVYIARQWNTELTWQMQEEMFRLYRNALQEEADAVREAYDERLQAIQDEIDAEEGRTRKLIQEKERRIQAIDEETAAQIAAIQRLIDALDIEGEQSDREEAERQHNKKIAKLREEYQYHALRTGLEHQKRMAEILQEIAEEERAWKLQQEEWAREDQKRAYEEEIDALEEQAKTKKKYLQQEIEDIRRASDEKKRELQDYYNEVQKLINSRTLDMLASLATTDEQWYQRGVEMMRRLAEGIRDGSTELPDEVREFFDDAKDAHRDRKTPSPNMDELTRQTPIATITSSQYISSGGRAYMHSRSLGNALGESVEWDQASGRVKIGSRWFTPWKTEDGKTYVGVREVAEALGYRVEFDAGNIFIYPRAHTGAYVAGSGVAELLKGERVLSPQMTVSFDRLANVLANFPNIPERISLMQQGYGNLDRLADRIIAAIERRKGIHIERLFNAENVEFADRTDMEIFSRELVRAANMLQTARG